MLPLYASSLRKASNAASDLESCLLPAAKGLCSSFYLSSCDVKAVFLICIFEEIFVFNCYNIHDSSIMASIYPAHVYVHMAIRVGTRWHNMITDASTDSVALVDDSQSLTYWWTSRKSKISGANSKTQRANMGAGQGEGQGEGQGSGGEDGCRLLALIAALFFPPLAIALVDGCGCSLLINILLCLLGYIPGIIHAFYVVLKSQQ